MTKAISLSTGADQHLGLKPYPPVWNTDAFNRPP